MPYCLQNVCVLWLVRQKWEQYPCGNGLRQGIIFSSTVEAAPWLSGVLCCTDNCAGTDSHLGSHP